MEAAFILPPKGDGSSRGSFIICGNSKNLPGLRVPRNPQWRVLLRQVPEESPAPGAQGGLQQLRETVP